MEEKSLRRASQDSLDTLLYFLDTYVYTLDEHDPNNPVKKLPMHKQYMRDLAELFYTEPLLLVEKSRQMMVTWLMCACHLWDAMMLKGRRIFFQSKKEHDANANIDRAKFIYDHLPDYVKLSKPARQPFSYLKLEFPKWNSIIEGTPQGADVLRQYTSSRIFSDETAFQERAEESYMAAKPSLTGGGKMTMVSTPNFKNFFYLVAKDKV